MQIEPVTVYGGLLKRIPGTEIYFFDRPFGVPLFDSAESALKALETSMLNLSRTYKNDCPTRRRILRDLKLVREQLRFLALREEQ